MENKKIALFIDAENISSDYAKFIFDKVSSYGEIIIKRIYADWTNEQPKIGKIILVNILLRLYNALPLQVKKILATCILRQILQKFYMKRI